MELTLLTVLTAMAQVLMVLVVLVVLVWRPMVSPQSMVMAPSGWD
jgi:hypothetical protein